MAPFFTWPTFQVILLGLIASSLAQFQSQGFDDFGAAQQFQQPQSQRFDSQRQFQSQPQRIAPKIRRPQSNKFLDPQSVTISPSSSQGLQSPQARFTVNQQFDQPATRPTVKTHQFQSEFVQGGQPVQATQDAFQQQPPVQAFDQAPVTPLRAQFQEFQEPIAPQLSVRPKFREPQQPVGPQLSVRSQFREPQKPVAPQLSVRAQFREQEPVGPQLSVRSQFREQEPVVVAPVRTTRPRVSNPLRQSTQAEIENNEEITQEQAEAAKYSFKASVTDTLSDSQNVREEVRDGLSLQGVYSYSDGYFKRTVHYEADENGYRVVKEDVEPIGEGPQEDPNGAAEVRSNVGGTPIQYTITSADINPRLRQPQQQARFLQQ